MNVLILSDLVAQPGDVDVRVLAYSRSGSLYYDVIERKLHRAHFVHTLPRLYHLVHVDLHGKVEVRRAELAFREPARNGLPHLRYSDFFRTLLSHYGGQYYGRTCLGSRCGFRFRLVVLDVSFDNAALVSGAFRSEEHTSELQSRENLVCRLLLEKKKKTE